MQSSTASSFAAFEKMEEKVMALEAEAESTAALATPDALEARFSQVRRGRSLVELFLPPCLHMLLSAATTAGVAMAQEGPSL